MKSSLPLIYALAVLAQGAARAKEPGTVKAGVVLAGPDSGLTDVVKEMAQAFDMSLLVIDMSSPRDDGHGVREIRALVTATLAEGKPVIFVLDEADAADGDMLMRVTRAIDEAATDAHAVILAVGRRGGDADALAMEVADGMRTHKGMIAGSSTFMDQMDGLFERAV